MVQKRVDYALLTLDEKGYPLLDGKKIPGITAFTLKADNSMLATLTLQISVRLNPEMAFECIGDNIGSDCRES